MTPRHTAALKAFFALRIGPEWERAPPVHVSPDQALTALWQLNDLYQPHHALIGSLPYLATHEQDADRALRSLAMGRPWTAADPKPLVWRVLLERHSQSIVVVQANELHGSASVAVIPSALAVADLPLAVALFLQFEMVLPWPAGQPLPTGPRGQSGPPSLLRH